MNIGYDVEINVDRYKILRYAEQDVARARKGTAREFERLARPYVPWLTGTMCRSSYTSDFAKGEVTYDTPYARFIYYASSGTNLTKDKHPNATVRWGDFVKSKYKDHFVKVFQQYLDKEKR